MLPNFGKNSDWTIFTLHISRTASHILTGTKSFKSDDQADEDDPMRMT